MRLVTALIVLACCNGVAFAAAVDQMEFPNKKGTVFFSHRKHEDLAERNCKVCHDQTGAIQNFGKAFAHRVCIGCHEPEPGKLAGPVSCEGCHSAM